MSPVSSFKTEARGAAVLTQLHIGRSYVTHVYFLKTQEDAFHIQPLRERERERQRETERDRERQRQRETETETDRQTDRQTDSRKDWAELYGCTK